MKQVAVIFGTGPGLGAALARRFAKEGLIVAVAARDIAKLSALAAETGMRAFSCDVGHREQVEHVFSQVEREMGPCEIVVFNAAQRYRDSLTNLDPDRVANAFKTGAFGGLLVGQAAARAMLPRGQGSIFFTGATASVKGMAQSAPFAMQKFALRGLAQSMARELHPRGIHVAHIIIDGRIASATGSNAGNATLDPNAIATAYFDLHRQESPPGARRSIFDLSWEPSENFETRAAQLEKTKRRIVRPRSKPEQPRLEVTSRLSHVCGGAWA